MWSKLFLVLAFACADCTQFPGQHAAIPVDAQGHLGASEATPSGLIVRGDELTRYSSRYFGALVVTFENRTADWVRVERVSLDFQSVPHNDGIFIPWGDDLASWASATEQRDAIREANADAALGVLALGGMVAATAGGRGPAGRVGGVVALGSIVALAANHDEAGLSGALQAQPFGEGHLLTVPFSVPPGLFVRKWIVLNTRGTGLPCLASVLISYDVVGRGTERVELSFRSGSTRSEWQADVCPQDEPANR
jgi:hypothetical protein